MIEPTPSQKFLYYTLGLTPPVSSREWVERDIQTTGWQVRRALTMGLAVLLGLAIVGPIARGVSWDAWESQVDGALLGALIGGLVAGLLQATLLAGYVRRRTLAYYEKRWDRQLID